MFRLFLDVTWKPVSCPLERRIEELLGTLQPGDGLLVNELSLLGRAKGPWGMSKLDGKGLARGFAQSSCPSRATGIHFRMALQVEITPDLVVC